MLFNDSTIAKIFSIKRRGSWKRKEMNLGAFNNEKVVTKEREGSKIEMREGKKVYQCR